MIYAYHLSPRCGAKTKRNYGSPCRAPAVQGKKRCRMHGGSKDSGAQKGNLNALKHGFTTNKAKKFRKEIKSVLSSLSAKTVNN
jgi:hypothetical protein